MHWETAWVNKTALTLWNTCLADQPPGIGFWRTQSLSTTSSLPQYPTPQTYYETSLLQYPKCSVHNCLKNWVGRKGILMYHPVNLHGDSKIKSQISSIIIIISQSQFCGKWSFLSHLLLHIFGLLGYYFSLNNHNTPNSECSLAYCKEMQFYLYHTRSLSHKISLYVTMDRQTDMVAVAHKRNIPKHKKYKNYDTCYYTKQKYWDFWK